MLPTYVRHGKHVSLTGAMAVSTVGFGQSNRAYLAYMLVAVRLDEGQNQ